MLISDWSSDVGSSDLADTYRGCIVTYDIEESGVGYLLATQDAVVGGVFGSLLEALGRSQVVLKGNTSEMLEGIAEGRYLIGYNVLGSYAQVWAERNRSIGIVLPSDYTQIGRASCRERVCKSV